MNKRKVSRFEVLKENYKRLYFSNNELLEEKEVVQSEEEKSRINDLLEDIENLAKESIDEELNTKRKRYGVYISSDLNKLKGFKLTLEQNIRLKNALMSIKPLKFNLYPGDCIDAFFARKIEKIDFSILDKLLLQVSKACSIQEIERIKEQIPTDLFNKRLNPYMNNLLSKMNSKTNELRIRGIAEARKNEISEQIQYVLNGIIKGEISADDANKIIEAEAKRKYAEGPKGIFTLTLEKQIEQVKSQILIVLRDNFERFPIQDSKIALSGIQNIACTDKSQALKIVINNLIGQKRYEEAKKIICDNELIESEKNTLMRLVTTSEISDLVIKQLQSEQDLTDEEGEQFLETLENGIKNTNISMNNIFLGTNQSGRRKIYLSNIWPENERTK